MEKEEFREVIEGFREGDKDKFEIIYKETNNKLYNYIFSLSDLLNYEDCYEILQDTYILVNNKIDTLKDSNAFNSWVFTIARNRTLRYLEKKNKEVLLSDEGQHIFENQLETDIDILPEEILDTKEKQRLIKEILDSLPEEQKEVIILRYYNGLSVKEIARNLNISDGTVKSRLNYGRKKVQIEVESLEEKGTKLYSSSLPVVLLLLRFALGGKNLPQEREVEILSNIINKISFTQGEIFGDGCGEEVFNNGHNNTVNDSNADTYNKNLEREFKSTPKNLVSESVKGGISNIINGKMLVGGLLSICLIGTGIFSYRSLNNEGKNIFQEVKEGSDISEEIGFEQGEDEVSGDIAVEDSSDEISDGIRFELSSYKIDVKSLYDIVKYNNFFGKDGAVLWDFDDFIGEIELYDSGDGDIYYDSIYPMWAKDIIHFLLNDVEVVVSGREKISGLQNLNEEEKNCIKETEAMLEYFVSNQEKIEMLAEKIRDVANHDGNEKAQNVALEFLEEYDDYEIILKKIK